MPTSEHDPSDALLPATPEGYDDPEPLRYSMPVVLVVLVLVLPVAMVGFGSLLWLAQGSAGLVGVFEIQETETSVEFSVRASTVAVAFVVGVLGTSALHELVHGLAFRLRGYEPSYGVAVNMGAFYAAAFHQYQGRRDAMVSLVAPLVVLDLCYLPLLFAPSGLVAFTAFVGLLINTGGAAGDIYMLARVWRMPEGTLLYDSDARHSYVFFPAE